MSGTPVCFNQQRSQSGSQFTQFMPELKRFTKCSHKSAVCDSLSAHTVAKPRPATGRSTWECNNRLMWLARPQRPDVFDVNAPLYIIQPGEMLNVSDGIQGQRCLGTNYQTARHKSCSIFPYPCGNTRQAPFIFFDCCFWHAGVSVNTARPPL